MKFKLIIFLCFVFLMPSFARHERTELVKNVRGEYTVTANSQASPLEAKEKAREDAMRKALIQAFGQQINIFDQIETSSAGESFNSMSVLKNNGEIEKFTVVEEGFDRSATRSSEMIFYCVANVLVKEGVAPDPSFTATINGIHSSYINNEYCVFTITPSQNSYLKVFIYENSEVGYYLYPGGNHHGVFLKADTPIQLPKRMDPNIQLYTNKNKETNTIVMLLTKEEYPFNVSNPTRQDIDKFIALIPNDKKYVSYHIIDILKR